MLGLAWKVLKRQWAKSVVSISLITASLLLLSVGVFQYTTSMQYIFAIAEEYVTVAVIDDASFKSVFSSNAPTEQEYLEYNEGRIKQNEALRSKLKENVDFSYLFGYRPGLEERVDAFHIAASDVLQYQKCIHVSMASEQLRGSLFYQEHLYPNALHREHARAYFEGNDPVKSAKFSNKEQINPLLGPVTGTCLRVEVLPPSDPQKAAESPIYLRNDGKFSSFGRIRTIAYFKLDHSKTELIDAARQITYLKLVTSYAREDGSPLFDVGKTYTMALGDSSAVYEWLPLLKKYDEDAFVIAKNSDPGIYEIDPEPQWYILSNSLLSESSDPLSKEALQNLASRCEVPIDIGSNSARVYRGDGCFLYDKSMEQHMKEKLKTVSRGIRFNTERLLGIVTENIKLIPEFGEGLLSITEKSLISDDSNTIYISEALAQANGIHVDDVVSFDLDYVLFNRLVKSSSSSDTGESTGFFLSCTAAPMNLEELKFTDRQLKRTYRVGGLFVIHPDYGKISKTQNRLRLAENVVFVVDDPRTMRQALDSVDAEKAAYYAETHNPKVAPGRVSARLKNGEAHIKRYLEESENEGLRDYILSIHDGGYREIESSILDLQQDTKIFLLYALVSGSVLFIVFLFLFVLWTKPNIKLMELQGANRSLRIRYMATLGWMEVVLAVCIAILFSSRLSHLFVREELRSSVHGIDLLIVTVIFAAVFGLLILLVSLMKSSAKRLM